MTLRVKRGHSYGDNHEDLRAEILNHSKDNGYPVDHFGDAICKTCTSKVFRVALDDSAGCAERHCISCENRHFIGDSSDYADEAELEDCSCPCESEEFEVAVGLHLYSGSKDVKWLYLGLRCTACGLVAVYGDWKNEFEGYEALLARI